MDVCEFHCTPKTNVLNTTELSFEQGVCNLIIPGAVTKADSLLMFTFTTWGYVPGWGYVTGGYVKAIK